MELASHIFQLSKQTGEKKLLCAKIHCGAEANGTQASLKVGQYFSYCFVTTLDSISVAMTTFPYGV